MIWSLVLSLLLMVVVNCGCCVREVGGLIEEESLVREGFMVWNKRIH